METVVTCRTRGRRNLGFTLIELLVVVAVIVILLAILLPSLHSAREQAKTVVCANNIKQFCLAEVMYTQLHDGYLPTAWEPATWRLWADHLGKDALIPKPVNDNVNGIHRCPSEDRPTAIGTCTHYGQNRFANTWNIWIKVQQITAPAITALIYDASITPNYDAFSYETSLMHNANITGNRHVGNRSRNYGFIDGHVECMDRFRVAQGVYRWVLIDWQGNLIDK